jgi:DNA (cytosine-5)-methyltransferase 1
VSRSPEARLYLEPGEIVVDSFAGGGGASYGIALALGRGPDIAINHDAEAIALHAANHPDAEHYTEDVWKVHPVEACRGRRVGLMWLSPDCKHFSKAKGGKPVNKKVRGLAWVAVRWAKAVQPRILVLENVEEFQTWGPVDRETNRPDPARKGLTFRKFVGRLRGLGYQVEWRELRGCDYGAPTIRKRLFLIARRDGVAITWPTPTHGKGRALPWRTAAECIDFDRPCPSIFVRKKPLAENTLKRIGAGLRRFVFEADRPFIVNMAHGGKLEPLTKPLSTIATEKGGCRALVTPVLVEYHGAKRAGDDRALDVARPLPVQDTSNRFGLITPLLVPRYGERLGQEPRAASIEKPMPRIVPTQNGASLVAGFLAKHYGGHETPGTQLDLPISTLTTQDHHALITSNLVKLSQNSTGQPTDEPLHTVMAGATRFAEVRAFLVAYYGNEKDGGSLFEPMRTVTSKERFGLVTVDGQEYQLADIGMRMLAPRELYRAQGFPDSYKIDIEFKGKPMSKTAQVRMCGNSVVPQVAAAIVRANVAAPSDLREVA